MKKVLTIVMALLLSVSPLCLRCYAEPTVDDAEPATLLELLTEKPYADGLFPAFDPKLLPEEFANYSMEDKPVLAVFNSLSWGYAAYPQLEEGIVAACEETALWYVVWDDILMFITKSPIRNSYRVRTYDTVFDTVPTYVKDIASGSVEQYFLGNKHTIENIICFDGASSRQAIMVYYITDGGTFVRYYENLSANAIEYTFEEFQPYAAAYHALITSYEYNYDEKGQALYGGGVSFSEFMANPEKYQVPVTNDTTEMTQPSPGTDTQETIEQVGQLSKMWRILAVTGLGVVVLGLGVFLLIRHRRSSTEDET